MAIKSKKRKLTTSGRSAVEARSTTTQAEAELEREEEEMLAMTRLLKQVDETEAVSVAKKMMLEASGNSEVSNAPGAESTVNGHSEDSVTAQQGGTIVDQSSHVNGSASTMNGSTTASEQDGERWVGNLTVENVERQNDTHEKERLEQSQDLDRDTTSAQQEPSTSAAGVSTVADESGDPTTKRPSLRASARKTNQSQDGHNGTSTYASSRPARGVSSARSDVSDSYSSNGSIASLAANLPVIFRPDDAEGSTSAIVSGFEMPIKDLTQPRLSQALISRKARTIYAPEAIKAQPAPSSPENVKRRPGRPPGYFLGPTSCAYCRQQHRRCDYNTVCHRCIKAKIPCDRSGTVERPSIIVREARIQAKAEAAAVLELAVAAGYAEQPDPKVVVKPKSRATTAASRSSARVQSWDQGSPSSSSTTSGSALREGVKRRRSPSPSSISRDNIIQQRVKRVAAARGAKAYEPNPPLKSSRATVANRSRAESSRQGPSSISTSEDGRPEVIESDFADYNDDHTSTQADGATSTASNPSSSTSTPTASKTKKVPLGSSTISKIATPATTVQRAYKSAAELARISPPNALQKTARVRVRVAKTADTTGKRKAGRPPGGKFVPTSAHLTPANQAILIRAQSVTNPQAVEPETMRMMMMLKRRPGRPPWKHTLPQPDPVVKRPVGRPTNAERFALNPSLIPPPKTLDPNRRGPGRPIRSPNAPNASTSSSTQAKSLIPAPSSKSNSSKATPATSRSVIPAKRSHATASASHAQASTSTSTASKGKSVASRAVDTADDDTESNKSEPTKSNVRLVKKAYLKSGLYSSDLKVNPDENSAKNGRTLGASRAIVSSRQRAKAESAAAAVNNNNTFFELPINYGSVLMSRQKDFTLPFDIMQAWQQGLLRKTVQPEPFIKIRSNIFVERKRRTETSPMVCHCKPPRPEQGRIGCGDDCYNRVMFYECISAHCPCGDLCSNQRFQKKHNEDNLRVIWTQERGFGIQTTAPIKKGNLVIEYRGEVISQAECHKRMEGIYKNNKNFYFLEYEKGEVVDACQKGTNARFVNHSCSPNSQIEKWFLNGEMSIGIFAAQDIPSGAEISYDYNFSSFSGAQKQKCRCGALNCRGYIGERLSKNKEAAAIASTREVSGRSGSKASAKKRKTGRRGVSEQESSSLRMGQMPSVGSIRQRQSDKYKEGKMAAIRYTRLFLFRNIRLVESKYVKYAQTKSRSFQERVSPTWLAQARECRKRSLEGVIEELREKASEQAAAVNQERFADDLEHAGSSIAGDDATEFLQTASIVEIQETDLEEDGGDGTSQYDLSEERSRSPSQGSQQHYSNGVDQYEEDYEEDYEENAGGEEYADEDDEEVEGLAAGDEAEEEEGEQHYEVDSDEANAQEANGAGSTTVLTINGVGAKNRSESAESLGSTLAAEYSPVSVQGSVDTLVEDTKIAGPKDMEDTKSKKDSTRRRLRNRDM